MAPPTEDDVAEGIACLQARCATAAGDGQAASHLPGGQQQHEPHMLIPQTSWQRHLAAACVAGLADGNLMIALPVGLGMRAVVEEVVRQSLAREGSRQVVLVQDRPAQALSCAARLRAALSCPVGV